MPINNSLQSLVNIASGDVISGIANISQILDLTLNIKQVSNDEIMEELLNQNKNYLEYIIKFLTNNTFQNDRILSNQKILLEQNEKILSLLGGNK